jgi:hypothetical protein
MGVVVTLQPFHLANMPDFRRLIPPVSTTVTTASAAEVEALVTVDDMPVSRFLTELPPIRNAPPGPC